MWKDLVCLIVVLVGLAVFLYGSNSYGEMIGWTGIGLFLGGMIVYVFLKEFESSRKKKEPALLKAV